MKKILILGANNEQIQLINAAKAEGYEVIVCDYTNDHPGIPLADKHYQVSYLDLDAVLSIGMQEHIDGVIGNSDPAMPAVAYISNRLGLVGNSPESIDKLVSKSEFRKLQEQAGLYCPKHIELEECINVETLLETFNFPIVVKPSESAGSQGTTKIFSNQKERFYNAFQTCKELSRNGKVTVEEYVEMRSLEVIEGDVFVMGDDILWNGLFTTRRSIMAPMVPMTYIFPAVLSQQELSIVKEGVSCVFKEAGICHGEYNIEMYFTSKGELFIIEINPRQGGHCIPQLVEMHSGIDFSKLLVTTAVGDNDYYNAVKDIVPENNFITNHVVFSRYNGILEGIECKPEIQKYLKVFDVRRQVGTNVYLCDNATRFIAYATLLFPDRETQLAYSREKMEECISVKVKGRQIPVVDCTLPYQLIYNFMTGDAYDFFVPKLLKAHRTVEDYAEQFANFGAIAYETDSGNNLIGMVGGYVHNLTIPGWSYIAEVYVNSDHRKKGLGEKLLTAYIDYCKSLRMKGVWLNVTERNFPAQNLYKKFGFQFDETYNDQGYLKMVLNF